jgi:hypothetical protein
MHGSAGRSMGRMTAGEQLGARPYRDVLRTWTRQDRIYRGLDNKLFVSATYHAPGFRRAFAVAFPDIYGHGGKVTRRELVDMTDGVEQHHNFLMAMYTPDARWNDFAREDSIWRMSLYSKASGEDGLGEAEVSPDEIVPLKMDENLRAVYPYITRFDRLYLVRFPLVDALHRPLVDGGTGEMVLRVASALGVASMRWDMGGEGRATAQPRTLVPLAEDGPEGLAPTAGPIQTPRPQAD